MHALGQTRNVFMLGLQATLIYLVIDFFHIMNFFPGRIIFGFLLFLLALFVLVGLFVSNPLPRYFVVFIILAVFLLGGMRAATDPRMMEGVPVMVYDSAVSVEEAALFFLEGKNPYATDFFGTQLDYFDAREQAYWSGFGLDHAPYLYHYAYFPVSFLFPAPFFALFGRFDVRWLFSLLMLFGFWLLFFLMNNKEHAVVLLLALSLLLEPMGFFWGLNDVVILFLAILAMALAVKNHWRISWVTLGLMAAFKLTAVPILFFFGLWAVSEKKLHHAWAGVLVFLAAMLPFIIWDARAFLEDTIFFIFGGIPTAYPSRGLYGGLPLLLETIGFSAAQLNSFPFWILQGFVVLALLPVLLKRFFKEPLPGNVFLYAGVFMLVFTLFSRLVHSNYVIFSLSLLLIGAFWPDEKGT